MTRCPTRETGWWCLSVSRLPAVGALLVVCLSLGACASGLLPKPQPQATLLVLEAPAADALLRIPARQGQLPTQTQTQTQTQTPPLPLTLVVDTPRAAAGFDTRNIAYVRRAHEVEYFAVHQWVDTPARMLAPIMAQALQRRGSLRSVVLAPTAASGELRLETELVRLHQDFTRSPSQVRLSLRVLLVDTATRRALAWRELDAVAVSPSEDPYGGAVAANAALAQVLQQLVVFVAESSPK